MRAWQLTWTELRRITSTRMARITVLALVLVPTIYAGLYLYANHDPYGALSRVPAALVVDDTGVEEHDGSVRNAGRDVADELLDGGDFDWHETSRTSAEQGVAQGRYDFALVIPAHFSASLDSVAEENPEQARLVLLTNDANSYLSTTIANTVVGKVRDAVTAQVGHTAALTFLTGIADTRQGLLDGADGARQVARGADTAHDGAVRVRDGAGELAEGAEKLAAGAATLHEGLSTAHDQVAALPRQTRRLADGAEQVADGNATLAGYGDTAADVAQQVLQDWRTRRAELRQRLVDQGLTAAQVRDVMAVYDRLGTPVRNASNQVTELSGRLDQLRDGSRKVADGNATLARATPELVSGIARARDGAQQLDEGAGSLAEGAGTLHTGASDLSDGVGELADGAHTLARKLRQGAQQIPATDDEARERMAEAISDPVAVKNSSDATAGSYGEGLAPFFLALSAWIGGYVLFLLVRPLSRRALSAGVRSWRVAVGGWGSPALIGAAQVALVVTVVALAVGVLPRHVPLTLAFMVLASATFIAVIHLLCAWLGSPGQFLALVLMVVQLVSAGGTFPWQTIPEPLYPLHHVLPMSHAVDGLRQAMYGGATHQLGVHALVLAAWLVGSLVLTSLVARRQRAWTPKRVNPEFTM